MLTNILQDVGNHIEWWMVFLAGLPGLFALIYNLIKATVDWKKQPIEGRKTNAEAGKTKAETTKIEVDTLRNVIDELQEQTALLRSDLNNEKELRIQLEDNLKIEKSARIAVEHTVLELKEKQQWYEKYINALLNQMKKANITPVERPSQLMPVEK